MAVPGRRAARPRRTARRQRSHRGAPSLSLASAALGQSAGDRTVGGEPSVTCSTHTHTHTDTHTHTHTHTHTDTQVKML